MTVCCPVTADACSAEFPNTVCALTSPVNKRITESIQNAEYPSTSPLANTRAAENAIHVQSALRDDDTRESGRSCCIHRNWLYSQSKRSSRRCLTTTVYGVGCGYGKNGSTPCRRPRTHCLAKEQIISGFQVTNQLCEFLVVVCGIL